MSYIAGIDYRFDKSPKVISFYSRFVLLIVLLGSQVLYGQKITIYSQNTLQQIPNVTVINQDTSFVGLSNQNGVIYLRNVKPTDTLIFRHASFHTEHLPMLLITNYNFEVLLFEKKIQLDGLVISADKIPETVKNITNKIDIISSEEIAFQNPQTSADMLENSGNVFVQKSQSGGGSPVLRGFEANKVLIVVDGVRMNNAIYRSGHLQNVITLDNAILDRTEIVYGPGSLIYGSDALGGVMHFITRDPKLAVNGDTFLLGLNAFTRYSSANNENTAHVDINIAGRKLGSLSSVTFSEFNNVMTGNNRNPFYPDFGKTLHQVIQNEAGIDTMVENENYNLQLNTAYSQLDLLQKFYFRMHDKTEYRLNFQYSTSSDISRYDALNEYKNGILRNADWHYGPQNRFMASLNAKYKANGKWFNSANLVAAFQRLDEDRITRKFKSMDEIHRKEDVWVYSLSVDMVKRFSDKSKLIYGVDGSFNHVASMAFSRNIQTDETTWASTRYPDGGSNMAMAAAFAKFKYIPTDKLILSAGVRFNYIYLASTFTDTTLYSFSFDQIDLSTSSLTGSVGITYHPGETWQINMLISSGFRAPNVDDFGKVFESGGQVIVPNNKLKSEYAYNGEIGIANTVSDVINISATGFYTLLLDAIVRRDFTLNGIDTIIYDGAWYPVVANTNANHAYIYGFSFNIVADISKHLSLRSFINITNGWDKTDEVPLAHIPPVYGLTSIKYNLKKLQAEYYMKYNGWKKIEDFSPSGEDNQETATEHGMPSWFTLNIRATYQFNRFASIQIAMENILDQHYRVFASGVSAPGRNLVVTLRGYY